MANTTALSSLSSAQAQLLGTRTVAFKDESTGYVFSIDSDGDVVYAKTTNGGASFGSAVTVFSSIAAVQLTIWADWWTSGDTGSLIHIWYVDDDSGDVLYRSLDTSSDTLGTQRTVLNSTAAQYNKLSATKTRGGMLAAAFYLGGVGGSFYTSTDGVSWSSRANPFEAEEQVLLLPANLADDDDLWCFYWDWSANAITLKTFDDSANSWSESSTILTAVATDPNVSPQPQFAAAVRWSDGHAILVAHMWYDSTSDQLQVVDVTNGSSWTSKANVTSGNDDTAMVAIAIDQNTDDLYVAYGGDEDGSETMGSSVGIYYKKSTNGGASWGAQQSFSELVDDFKGLWVDHGSQQFLFAPVFFNDDLNRVETNANNAVEITPPPPATATAALALWVPELSATGTHRQSGGSAFVLWAPSLAATGDLAHLGAAGLVLWAPVFYAGGGQQIPGSGALTLWRPILAATGYHNANAEGVGGLQLWAPSLAATGVLNPDATAAFALWVPVVTASGSQDLPGAVALGLWVPVVSGSGLQKLSGSAALSLWLPTVAGAGEHSHVGGAALTVWVPALSASGGQRHAGTAALALWAPTLAADARHGYVHGTGGFTAPFPVFVAVANFPVPSSCGRLRVDVYTAAGEKLAFGALTAVLEANYSLGLDLVGEFAITLPAVDRSSSYLAQGQRLWIYREGEGLLFKGIIERLQTEVSPDGAHLLHVSGASISRQLVWANTLLGRNYSAATLADAVADLLTGTGWTAGELAAPGTTLEATFEGASRWSALLKVAEIFGLHLREDPWTETVDLAAFGSVAPFVLQNVETVSPRLRENAGFVPVASVSVAEEGTELWNSTLVHGAGEGINRLSLQWSSRSSPYAVQSATGPDGEPYWYLEDAASVAAFGRRETVIVDKDAIPLANSSAGLEAAANALYDGAVTWLQRHKDPLTTYTAKPVGLTHIDPSTGAPRFQVGEKVRLRYAGVVKDADTGALRAWKSVDAQLWLMGFSRTLNGDGSDDWELTLANVDRHKEDGASKVARALEELRALQVAKRPYTYAGSYGPYRDSVDATRGLVLPVNFKRNVYLLREAHLYVTRKKVKSNVSTVASGGGSTPTSSSGGSSAPTSSAESSHTHQVSGQTANAAGSHRHIMFARVGSALQTSAPASPAISAFESASGDPHYHGMSSHTHGVDRYQFAAVNSGGSFKTAYLPDNASSVYNEDLYTYSAAVDHTHAVSATTSAAGTSHSHTVSISAHSHTVTIPEHSHGLTYGIYEGPNPGSITAVIINGTDRTGALGGPWAADISELDVSAYLQDAGGEPLRQVNTIEVRGASLMDLIVEVKTLETATSIVPV